MCREEGLIKEDKKALILVILPSCPDPDLGFDNRKRFVL
jgi:hypothetical protein